MILSDNHGNWAKVHQIVEENHKKVDYIFHCGDSEFTPDDPIWKQIDGVVKGNMDFQPDYPIEFTKDTAEGIVYMTHGHLQDVRYTLNNILENGKNVGAEFIFYGHTHQLTAQMQEGILIVNPGSLHQSRGVHPERTYAIVEVQPSRIEVDFYDDNMKIIPRLSQSYSRRQVSHE